MYYLGIFALESKVVRKSAGKYRLFKGLSFHVAFVDFVPYAISNPLIARSPLYDVY